MLFGSFHNHQVRHFSRPFFLQQRATWQIPGLSHSPAEKLKNQNVDGTSKVTKYSPVISLYRPKPKGTSTASTVPRMITVPMMEAKKLTILNSRSLGGAGVSFSGYGSKFFRDTKLVMLCSVWRLTIHPSFSSSHLMSSTGSPFKDVRSVKPVSFARSPTSKDTSWIQWWQGGKAGPNV